MARWLLRPAIAGVVAVQAQLVDAAFVYRQGIAPGPLGRFLKYVSLGLERVRRSLAQERQDVIFERYNRLHSVHYGPTGRGYGAIPGDTASQWRHRYETQTSRLQFFAEEFSDLLRYQDGDVFADLGCGTGQNIRFLARNYPSSRVIGTDLNSDAVEMVMVCESNPHLELSVGDIRDASFLDSVLIHGVDHIVMSHVFSVILGDTQEKTHRVRQELVDRLVHAARKSVVIIDNFGRRNHMSITIEQAARAIVVDDVMSYFDRHVSGRTLMVQSGVTQAVMFCKRA